ncbi:MAG TPA: hypothetical protein VEK11_16800, partial [Thermoanaerobaculia bacterium]|nr:hypothetical protein [Thermoanaerobaculia bacterium]
VLLDENTAVVTWLEQPASGTEIRARRITRPGQRSPSLKVADTANARSSGFPRMAKVGSEVWFAWTSADKRVELARGRF